LRPARDEKELYRSSIALPIVMLLALAEIYKYKTPKSVAGEPIHWKLIIGYLLIAGFRESGSGPTVPRGTRNGLQPN
jgi:hypothetical protein